MEPNKFILRKTARFEGGHLLKIGEGWEVVMEGIARIQGGELTKRGVLMTLFFVEYNDNSGNMTQNMRELWKDRAYRLEGVQPPLYMMYTRTGHHKVLRIKASPEVYLYRRRILNESQETS